MKLYYKGTEYIDYISDASPIWKRPPANAEGYFNIDEIEENADDIADIVRDFWKTDINGNRRFWNDNGEFDDRKLDDPPWEEYNG